jgi:hypothetical protein
MTIDTTKIINKKYQKLKKENISLKTQIIEFKKEITKLQRQNAKNKIATFIIRAEQKATENEFTKRMRQLPPSPAYAREQAWEEIQKRKQFNEPA